MRVGVHTRLDGGLHCPYGFPPPRPAPASLSKRRCFACVVQTGHRFPVAALDLRRIRPKTQRDGTFCTQSGSRWPRRRQSSPKRRLLLSSACCQESNLLPFFFNNNFDFIFSRQLLITTRPSIVSGPNKSVGTFCS